MLLYANKSGLGSVEGKRWKMGGGGRMAEGWTNEKRMNERMNG